MKKYIYLFILSCVVSLGFSQANRWGTKSRNTGNQAEEGYAIAADSSGNTYITGSFTDTVYFGANLLKGKGGKDVFVAKLDPTGNYIWSKSFGGNSDDEGYGIAVDNSGNIYVTGYFSNTLHLSATDSLISSGMDEMFAAKLDNNGVILQKLKAGTASTNDYGRGIAVNITNGDFAIVGDINNGTTTNYYVAKFNSLAVQQWTKSSVSNNGTTVTAQGISMDNAGKVYICGYFTGGNITTPNMANNGFYDAFAVVYASTGASTSYFSSLGSTNDDYCYSIHANGAGTNFYICGSFTNSINFGNSVSMTVAGTYAYLTTYFLSGTLKAQWAVRSPNAVSYNSVTADRFNNIIVSCPEFMGTIKFTSYGKTAWTTTPTGGAGTSRNYSVAADKYGNVYTSGSLATNLVFGDSTLTAVSPVNTNAFVQKISSPIIISPVNGSKACVSSASGDSLIMTINPSMTYKTGNIFKLQMDATGTGNFTSPITIGTLSATTNGTIHGYIPAGTTGATNLYFRVISTNPATTQGDQIYKSFADRPIASLTADSIKKCPDISVNSVTLSDINSNTGGFGTNYSWTPTTGVVSPTTQTPTFANTVSTQYTATVTDVGNGCTDSKTMYLLNYPQPIISAGNDTTVCRGSSVTLFAPSTNITTFAWTPSATLTGANTASPVSTPTAFNTFYTVTGTTAKGCVAQDIMQVTSPQTIANAGPASYNTCLGGSVQLTGTSNGSHGATGQNYLWNTSAGLNNSGIANPVATPTVTTMYHLTATDTTNGCTGKDSINVIVGPILVTATNATVTCGSTATLTAAPTGGNYVTPLSYSWTPATNLSVTTGTTTVANPIATTTYYVTMTTGNGCSGTAQAKVTVNKPNFNIAFTAAQQLITLPTPAQFTNSTPSMANYNFIWNFGDGVILQNNNSTVFHVYQYNGNFDVTLVAISTATGCSDTLFKGGYIFCTGGTSCALTATVTPTNGTSACTGDTVWLSSNTGSGYTYQWNLNGSAISGATSSVYGATVAGNYAVTVNNGACSVISQPKSVSFFSPPATPTITTNGNITLCGGGSVILTATSGYASYLWSTGATTQNITVGTSGVYHVSVGNGMQGCTSSASYSLNASSMSSPTICVVGVDSLTNQNMIVWEKPLSSQIDSFIIYKEGNVTNQFNRIGAQPYSTFSTFIDVNSNPAVQADRYEISLRDSCGVETLLSSYHKTIHLSINQGVGNSWNLLWNQYEGLSIPTYNIYRGTTAANMTLLTSLAGTNTSYTDLTPPTGLIYYQIEGINPGGCTPTAKMLQNYSGSRSNITNVNSSATGIVEFKDNTLNVYPNPFSDEITIVSSVIGGSVKAYLYNMIGEKVNEYAIESSNQKISLANLPQGVYYLIVLNKQLKIMKQQ